MREGLDFVLRFTLIGGAAIVIVVAITVGIFLLFRAWSRKGHSHKGQQG